MSTSEIAFDEIVAHFTDKPPCESSARCTRPARWRINLHGCEQAIMCGQHKAAWLRKVLAQKYSPRCAHCGRVFDSVDAAITVVAI
jgi:hypothetical protein